MTTPTLTIRPITGHSKGCDRRAFVTLDGAPCLAGTFRAADEAGYVADYAEINEAERILLFEDVRYTGCYRAEYDAGVKRAHRDGAFLAPYSIGYYTAEALREASAKLIIGEAGCAVTSHYEAPRACRILRDGETLNVRLVRRDGTTTDLSTTIKVGRHQIDSPIAH